VITDIEQVAPLFVSVDAALRSCGRTPA